MSYQVCVCVCLRSTVPRACALTFEPLSSFFDSQDGDFSLEIASISAFGPSSEQQQQQQREGGDDSEEEGEQEDLRKPPTGGFSGAEPLRHSSWGWRALFCGLL